MCGSDLSKRPGFSRLAPVYRLLSRGGGKGFRLESNTTRTGNRNHSARRMPTSQKLGEKTPADVSSSFPPRVKAAHGHCAAVISPCAKVHATRI